MKMKTPVPDTIDFETESIQSRPMYPPKPVRSLRQDQPKQDTTHGAILQVTTVLSKRHRRYCSAYGMVRIPCCFIMPNST